MAVGESISFWTPVQHYYPPNHLTPLFPTGSLRWSERVEWFFENAIENYFPRCGNQVALASLEKPYEVTLIDMENQSDGNMNFFMVLTYFTVVIPVIMLIAKIIFRCGSNYIIANEETEELNESVSDSSAEAGTAQESSIETLIPTLDVIPEPVEVQNNTQTRIEEKPVQTVRPPPTPLECYIDDAENEKLLIDRWISEVENGAVVDEIRNQVKDLSSLQLWNSLVRCCEIYLFNQSHCDTNEAFKEIAKLIVYELKEIDECGLHKIENFLWKSPDLFRNPPLRLLSILHCLCKQALSTKEICFEGLAKYFPTRVPSYTFSKLIHFLESQDDQTQFYRFCQILCWKADSGWVMYRNMDEQNRYGLHPIITVASHINQTWHEHIANPMQKDLGKEIREYHSSLDWYYAGWHPAVRPIHHW